MNLSFSSLCLAALLVDGSNAFVAPKANTRSATSLNSLEKYRDELKETAERLTRPGFGLVAVDESTGTVTTRLEGIGVESTADNRRDWRELIFRTPDLGNYVSGAILYEETLYQDAADGTPLVDVLKNAGIVPGIKVDMGLKPLCGGGDGENWCTGLDTLYDKCVGHYEKGARFAKWRTALRIDVEKGWPTDLAIDEAAHGLSRYARIVQEAGLCPIVEPEVMIDGNHAITDTAAVQEKVYTLVYKKLKECGVYLEGSLLKPAMTVNGVDAEVKASPEEVAKMTVQTLERTIPPAMPGVVFLSGGLSEEDSSIFLNEINKVERKGPWSLTFSFSRAMQSSCIVEWGGKKENVASAQKLLQGRAIANSEASQGKYVPGSQPSNMESLYVKDYVY